MLFEIHWNQLKNKGQRRLSSQLKTKLSIFQRKIKKIAEICIKLKKTNDKNNSKNKMTVATETEFVAEATSAKEIEASDTAPNNNKKRKKGKPNENK